ncbi:condensation domain-containing protein [Streptomyces sp. 1114.5]|uniref:non-ribosomal peptide synthetase n=1 Tax=unclassified Streptomyces TaxID=2593676 RepID=UPI000BD7FE1E|nr:MULTISPECIES: non-ribosomal peptide synthetase [unclassified Streptomyces]RKT08710.1 condensation domain-containing protein [Streptomyces sp. 1114.5]SOB78894.1 Condensation domain-containing protein [Streptomyces sp. 1331.2]
MHASITAAYLARYRAAAADSPVELLPLTGAQRRFLITRRLTPQSRSDIVPLLFAYPRGTLDQDRLARAAATVAARHPALCGGFATVRGTPVLRVGGPSVEVARIDAARIGTAPGGSAREALRRALLDWPLDGPALRLLVAQDPDGDEELLAVALDHAAGDEQSFGVLTAELSEAYRQDGTPPPAAGPDPQALADYRQAVELQLAAEDAAGGPAAQAHWGRRLAGLAGAGGGAATSTGMLTERLPAVGAAARGAVFPALLDAVGAVAHRLYRASGSRPPEAGGGALALGYPWGGRPPGAPAALGCFLNTLVHPAVSATATDLDALADAWWDDLDHAGTPFDEVVRAARTAGAPWTGSLDAMLSLEDLQRRPPLVLGGVPGRETHLAGRPLAAPLAVSAEHGDDLLIRLAWDSDRFPEDDAHAAFGELLVLLRHHLHGAERLPADA